MPETIWSTYQSPFSWRYGSEKMRQIWSEETKYKLWRKVWLALAQAQYHAGLMTKAEISDLEKEVDNLEIERILEIEKIKKHDVVSALTEYSEKAKIGGKKLHLGATSADITDNTDVLRIKTATQIIKSNLKTLLNIFADKIEKFADTPTLGYTHLQPAVPTTIGYRLAFYTQSLLENYKQLEWIANNLKTKGFKGAVGSFSSYVELLRNSKMTPVQMEKIALNQLGLTAYTITTQTYTRQQDYLVLSTLAQIAASLYKFAVDVRLLQSPLWGEWQEEFGKTQVGSSAMPHKKNPISAENICSLARFVVHLPPMALENAMHSYLERTLDDSANRKLIIPQAFLATDQILISGIKLTKKLEVHLPKIKFNLEQFLPFVATEQIVLAAAKKNADRLEVHEELRKLAVTAWTKVDQGQPNPLIQMYLQNKFLKKYFTKAELENLLTTKPNLKTAIQACWKLVREIKREIN